jgi:2-keto-4-pentenoate hydratase
VQALADELLRAQQQCIPVEPLLARFPDLTVALAYQIQMAGVNKRLKAGRRVVGKKIGLTSKAMQDAFGVFEQTTAPAR